MVTSCPLLLRRSHIACVAILLIVSGCIDVPELDARVSPQIANADYPRLVPLETLLGATSSPGEDSERLQGQLEARRANLARRADALRGDVVDAQTKQRMEQGVQQ